MGSEGQAGEDPRFEERALKPGCFIWSERGEPMSTLYIEGKGAWTRTAVSTCTELSKGRDSRRSSLGLRGRQEEVLGA